MSGNTLSLAPDPGVAVPWSPETGQRVLDLVAAGMALYKVANEPGMPSARTLHEWKVAHPEWATALAHARAVAAEVHVHDGLDILDAPLGVDNEGRTCSADATRASNRANYRKWLAQCLDRPTYGDALQIEAKIAAVVSCFVTQAPKQALDAAARAVLPVVAVRDVAEDEGAA